MDKDDLWWSFPTLLSVPNNAQVTCGALGWVSFLKGAYSKCCPELINSDPRGWNGHTNHTSSTQSQPKHKKGKQTYVQGSWRSEESSSWSNRLHVRHEIAWVKRKQFRSRKSRGVIFNYCVKFQHKSEYQVHVGGQLQNHFCDTSYYNYWWTAVVNFFGVPGMKHRHARITPFILEVVYKIITKPITEVLEL